MDVAGSIRHAEIIAIGSELLTPLRGDTNSIFLTRKLNEIGVEVRRKTVVGDVIDDLVAAISDGLARTDLLITMGGLGPTEDDRTREAVSSVLGRGFIRSESWIAYMRERFARAGRTLADNNLRQADLIEGAELIENPRGTAPGQWIPGRCTILMLPGPPRELLPMFEEHAMSRIRARAGEGKAIQTRILRVTGLTESRADSLIAPIYRDLMNPSVTILAAPGTIELHIRAVSEAGREAAELIGEVEQQFREKLGRRIYGADEETLESVVGLQLQQAGRSIVVAESCTGGLLAGRITDVAGSSAYFRRGYVCYSNESKVDELGVDPELISAHGAVSAEVAEAMARGALRAASADVSVAVTGIAGPGGGTPEKPVGLVYISVMDAEGAVTTENRFPGERAVVRFQATQRALDMLRLRLLGETSL